MWGDWRKVTYSIYKKLDQSAHLYSVDRVFIIKILAWIRVNRINARAGWSGIYGKASFLMASADIQLV